MAAAPVDPLQLLQAALMSPENTTEQADLLASLRTTLEQHVALIPILVHTLIRKVMDAEDSLLKRWILDLLHFALGRSTLTIDNALRVRHRLISVLSYCINLVFDSGSAAPGSSSAISE